MKLQIQVNLFGRVEKNKNKNKNKKIPTQNKSKMQTHTYDQNLHKICIYFVYTKTKINKSKLN